MKLLYIAVLISISNISFADSPGASQLFGVTKSGKEIMLPYQLGGLDTPEPYYFVEDEKLGFCIFKSAKEHALDCTDGTSATIRISYKYMKDGNKVARKLFEQHFKSGKSYHGYYLCNYGCNAKYVDMFIFINDIEGSDED